MKKIIIFFLLAYINVINAVHCQNQHGILVKTTLFPSKGWYGSHAGIQQITIGTKSINKTSNTGSTIKTEYNFVYINDEPNTIKCISSTAGNYDNTDCGPIEKNISYNKETFTQSTFNGCIAKSEIYGIHIIQTDANSNKCPEDVIELSNGWNWQYSFDGTSWIDFAANFQEQRAISFKIKELAGFENKTKVYFRAGYGTQFTNILPYDITPCTPKITQISFPNLTTCSYSKDGAVTFTFERELQDGEQYETALMYEGGAAVSDGNKTVYKSMMSNATYTWNNLAAANYILTYYTKKTVGSVEYLSNPPEQKSFTISLPPLFSFSAIETQPKCYGEIGTITITATGGTPPYYYYLNDDQKMEFISPITIEVIAGNNYIKVVDKKDCIDNTKTDTKS